MSLIQQRLKQGPDHSKELPQEQDPVNSMVDMEGVEGRILEAEEGNPWISG